MTYRVNSAEDIIPWLKSEQARFERNWKQTLNALPAESLAFFDCSHKVWFTCLSTLQSQRTITSEMAFLIWDELDVAFKQAMDSSYFSCVRSLRFVFEFSLQAAILEDNYAGLLETQTKLNKAWEDNDFKTFKRPMIDRLKNTGAITETEWEKASEMYTELSQSGGHPVGSFIRRFYEDHSVSLGLHLFDHDFFLLCSEFCRKVIDLFLVVLFNKYPQLTSNNNLKNLVTDLGLSIALSHMA